MKQKLFILICLISLIISCMYVQADEALLAQLESEAIILIEESNGKVLYEKNADQKMYPASTTKILTALVALEYGDLDEVVEIGNEVYSVPLDASKAGHLPGDTIVFKDLLKALLLPSGNDSAYAVASYIAKKVEGNNQLNAEEANRIFSVLMNEKAQEIGVTNSNFVNPHGYHDPAHYTTAGDLALITKEAMKNEVFKEIVKLPNASINSGNKTFEWSNRNLLIDPGSEAYYPYATGVKTGFTNEAGECLVASATKDDRNMIAVVLNSPEEKRWSETVTLFEYGLEEYSYHKVVQQSEPITQVPVEKHAPKGPPEVQLVAAENFTKLMSKDEISHIEKTISLNQATFEAPIEKGSQLGVVTYETNDQLIAEIPLIANETIQKRTWSELVFSLQAIPYWIGGVSGVVLITLISVAIHKKRSRRNTWRRY